MSCSLISLNNLPLVSEAKMYLKRVKPVWGRSVWSTAVLTIILSFCAGNALATKYAGAFMENGAGARALGMGGAFTAVADDPSATFWNPAGLAVYQNRELLLMHSERFGDLIDRDFASYVQPVGWSLLGGESSGFGISIIRLGVDDIPFTDHLADQLDTNNDGVVDDPELAGLLDLQDQIQYKSDQELAVMVSYAEMLGSWQIGASLKFINKSVGDYDAQGFGMDLGAVRRGIWKNLDFGIKFQDITTTPLSWSTGTNESISPAIIPGLAYNFPLPDWKMNVLVAGSLESRFNNRKSADQYWSGKASANAHLGAEVGFSEKVFVRAGYDSGWSAGNLTAGAGFRLNPLTVDYAYAGDSLDIDEVTHRISISVLF